MFEDVKTILFELLKTTTTFFPLLPILLVDREIHNKYVAPRELINFSTPMDGIHGFGYNPYIPQPWDADYLAFVNDGVQFFCLVIGCLVCTSLLQYTIRYLTKEDKNE